MKLIVESTQGESFEFFIPVSLEKETELIGQLMEKQDSIELFNFVTSIIGLCNGSVRIPTIDTK